VTTSRATPALHRPVSNGGVELVGNKFNSIFSPSSIQNKPLKALLILKFCAFLRQGLQ
jgi:hypothetical protein